MAVHTNRYYCGRYRSCPHADSLVVTFLDEVGEMASAAIVSVGVDGHEHPWSTHLMGALTAQAGHLVVGVHLVELQHSKFHLLTLVLDLLGLGIGLLLALLSAAGKLKRKEDGGFIRDATLCGNGFRCQ